MALYASSCARGIFQIYRHFSVAPAQIARYSRGTGAILSNNEEHVRITGKQLMYWANVDQLSALVEDFLGWLNKTKADNPN